MNEEQFIWTEKYRPKKVSDTILPKHLKDTFQEFVNKQEVPNLLLYGRSGVGKTTVAKAMLTELNSDYIVINGSLNAGIDTLRNDIAQFASTMSLKGGRKYVILDEADYLNPNSTQPALRAFIEDFAQGCGFIFTCNIPNKIIEPIHSRCSVIKFDISKDDKDLMTQFIKKITGILKAENVTFDIKVIAELVKKFAPDWRRILNELQRYSVSGKIDEGIFINIEESTYNELVEIMKVKDFPKLRVWVAEHGDSESSDIFRNFYDNAAKYFAAEDIPQLILILADYQFKAAFVADHEINTVAFLTNAMLECKFKE